MRAQTSRAGGFTLIELLVAVAVFTVVATLAWGGLDTIARTRQALDARAQQLAELQIAVGRFERDLRQAAARPVRNESGLREPALLGGESALAVSVWLPGAGWSANTPAAQRVAWSCLDGALQRQRWPALDRTPATPREQQSWFKPALSDCQLRYYGERGPPLDRWPPKGEALETLPRAVEFRFTLKGQGEFRRLIELPQNAEAGL